MFSHELITRVQKGKKVDVSDGSERSYGIITTIQTSTKLKNDYPLMDNHKNQQKVV
jgi:TPP-dependent trihydroxycyclohexane-1,2-dione (THcHDO) dehydratase